jgi:hypothetical protein
MTRTQRDFTRADLTRLTVAPPPGEAAGSIVKALACRNGPGEIGLCVQRPAGTFVEPRELWIESIGCWVRIDGTSASFDRGRGGVEFSRSTHKWIVATACAKWIARNTTEPSYWREHDGTLHCRHGVILYGTTCVQCERHDPEKST